MSAKRALARRRLLLAPALAVAAAVTAACGTTVPVTSQIAQDQGGTSGLVTGTTGTGADGITPAGPGSAPSRPNGGTTGAVPSNGSDTLSNNPRYTGAGPSGPAVSAPGVTSKTISIGMMTANGAGKYQRTLGFDQGATGDQIAMTRSVVDWLNKHGGIAGRRIHLVEYDVPTSDASTNPSHAYEAACRAFTEDNKVFAVAVILANVTPNFFECLRKHGVLAVTAIPLVSARFFQQFAGYVYAPPTPNYTRMLSSSVEALWADGWLTATSKVGVVGYDTVDAHAAVTDGLVPALKRHGLSVAAEFYTAPDSSGASAYNGGALKFQTAHVDRVFFAPGGQPILLGLADEQQRYHPYMSLSTLEYPDPTARTLPASTLTGAAGLGWSPYLDLPNATAAKVGTPARLECIDAVKAAQQDLGTGTTFAIATWICDDWFFLRDVLGRAPSVSVAGFRAAVSGLGSSFRSATTFRTLFGPNRTPDGAAGYRLNKYDPGCTCFRYASGIRTMMGS